jgi:NAD(P)-dependent dehydrogenase (short-subunit alcohol dehydrogenase family)
VGEERAIERPPALEAESLRGKVALITGGAQGLGFAVARSLLDQDAVIAIADIDEERGAAAADELGCEFFALDVTDLDANKQVVDSVVERFGGLHLAMLNAGIESPFSLGDDFDVEAYRAAMSINLDGVVFGFNAVRPAMIASGGGSVVATASLAGLAAMGPQPVYGANKAAVVGLVRALGPAHAHEGVRVNGICPGFADTRIIDGVRDALVGGGVPIISVEHVAESTLRVFADTEAAGKLLVIQAGVDPYYQRFPGIPRAQ